MQLFNLTQRYRMLDDLKIATRPWEKLRGLLFTKSLREGSGLWIKCCSSVHTIGMFYSLDLIFLDKTNRVIQMVHGLPPNCLSPWVITARSVIEVAAGYLSERQVCLGDKLQAISNGVSLFPGWLAPAESISLQSEARA